MISKTPIFPGSKINLKRYTSNLKRDEKYRDTVDSVLSALSNSLGIPYIELYNALFFKKGSEIKGLLVIK